MKSKYNLELLNQLSEKHGFKLIGEYEHLTNLSNIKGTCITSGCEEIFEKAFRTLYEFESFYCKECIKSISTAKQETHNMKHYGVKSTAQIPSVRKKMVSTLTMKSDEEKKQIRKKKEETNMKKFGVKAPAQNAEIAKKISKNCYKLKAYILPSGKIINLQGYEHHCLDDLIKRENIDEGDILHERTDVPEIWYKDENNVERRHFVDFFIKSLNKMVEVKSEWTLDKKLDKVFLKQKAAKELGYDYEIRVYSVKGKLLKTYS